MLRHPASLLEGTTMTRSRLSSLVGLGLAVLLAGSLTACATETPGSPPDPMDVAAPEEESQLAAGWLEGGRYIGLVTYGSSTCLPLVSDAVVDGDVLTVTLGEPADKVCTRDLVPRVSLVTVPEGVDPANDLTIELEGTAAADGSVVLPGVAGLVAPTEEELGLPSAGWTQSEGTFVFLTYGSSTCLPVVETVEATGDAEVTLTFAEPEANRACTMDFSTQPNLGWVEGLTSSEGAELVLTGDAYDNVRIPILGSN